MIKHYTDLIMYWIFCSEFKWLSSVTSNVLRKLELSILVFWLSPDSICLQRVDLGQTGWSQQDPTKYKYMYIPQLNVWFTFQGQLYIYVEPSCRVNSLMLNQIRNLSRMQLTMKNDTAPLGQYHVTVHVLDVLVTVSATCTTSTCRGRLKLHIEQ